MSSSRKSNETPQILVTGISGFRRFSKGKPLSCHWFYLGKNERQDRQIETRLGKQNRWKLEGRLHRVCAELRQPFLDFVAEVGTLQRDPIVWWSSRFSWKMGTASDFFLLLCYLKLAQEIVQESLERKVDLLILVEDPWLLHQLKENLKDLHPDVRVEARVWLSREKVKALFLGLAKRAWWLLLTGRNLFRQRRVWPRERAKIPHPPQPTVAIFSTPLGSSLRENAGWEDPYLPGLDELLREWGYRIVRFSSPEASGFEQELAKRASYFQPLILHATWAGLWRSLFAFWWPRWPEPLRVQGLSIKKLVEREWWMEVGRASLSYLRMFYECFQGMLRQGQWQWIVYPYENQPWEKMVALCAKDRGVRTAGILAGFVSNYYMPYFLGAGEAKEMPLPDVICTSGPYIQRILAEGGNPSHRLIMCGSVRYHSLAPLAQGNSNGRLPPVSLSEILVALPIDPWMARHLLEAIRVAFPMGGRKEGLRFHIRPHPMCPIDTDQIGFPVHRVPSNFQDVHQVLQACGLVLFTGTALGFEALAMGRAVLRYRSELLLPDGNEDVYGEKIPVCSDDTLREAVLTLVQNGPADGSGELAQLVVPQLFAPLNYEKLKKVFVIG